MGVRGGCPRPRKRNHPLEGLGNQHTSSMHPMHTFARGRITEIMKSTRVNFPSEAQYAQLDAIRDKYGLTWRGLLIRGAERLESTSPFPEEYGRTETEAREREE
jgi:hypothetical protein